MNISVYHTANNCVFDISNIVTLHAVIKCFLFFHYENMPIQIYRKFHLQKNENFQVKNSDSFKISAQNIDCGYSVEPHRRGGSNEYPQSMF